MMLKIIFDIFFSIILLIFLLPLYVIIAIAIIIENGFPVFFFQTRIGQNGKPFILNKFRTMNGNREGSSIAVEESERITKVGVVLRKTKLDELPELINILKGEMSFVGPRPDVQGYADELEGENRIILKFKPGITGLASLKYINEEEILLKQKDPKKYNDEIIYPNKVMLNLFYIKNWSFKLDILIILNTLIRKKWNEKDYKLV